MSIITLQVSTINRIKSKIKTNLNSDMIVKFINSHDLVSFLRKNFNFPCLLEILLILEVNIVKIVRLILIKILQIISKLRKLKV